MGKIVNLDKLSKEELIQIILQKDKIIHQTTHRNIELQTSIEELKSENIKLNELVKYYEIKMYLRQRNRLQDEPSQPTLFDVMEIEGPEAIEIVTEDKEVKAHVRKHVKKEAHLDFSHLPHEYIRHDENLESVHCPNCGKEMSIYKWEEQEELVYVPAQVKVVVHKTPRYICRECVNKDDHNPCVNPEVWKPLFPHSKCSSSLLASIIDYKYDMGLPLNTIERTYRENGIILPRQNMSNWLIASLEYIEPLYDVMHKDLLSYDVLAGDETTQQVIKEEGRDPSQLSYLWQYQNTIWDKQRIILYDYQPGRQGKHAANFLEGFNGYFLSDKYAGYDKLNVTHCYCHVHAMRYIRDAYELLDKKIRKGSLEEQAYKKYQGIFNVDNKIRKEALNKHPNDSDAQLTYIKENRVKTKKAFDEFLVWLEEIKPQVKMKPKFLKAINYVLEDQEGFLAFIGNAKVTLGNNEVEANFKPFILHRNRSKFFMSAKGVEAATKIYSLMITAKANGYSTYGYFSYLFDHIRYIDTTNEEELRKLLPYGNELPDYCKIMTKKELNKKIKELEAETK